MSIHKKMRITGVLLALFLLAFTGGTAYAVTYNLTAAPTTLTMPDGTTVPAWGYGLNGGPTVPGPVLVVPPGDNTLTINLTNNLPEATSLIILGQTLSNNLGPVFTIDASGLRRVMSFSHEAPAGGSATYSWNNFKPGTYMLQSGTNPAKQVQMGLYSAVKKDVAAGVEAYSGITYDEELIVVFHEVDPVIHNAIATGNYGPGTGIPSSVYREAAYFLINGKAYPDTASFAATAGKRLLVRFINAGLVTHVPQFLGTYMTLVAEDGNKYLYAKEQTGVEIPPAKRVDAIVVPEAGSYPLYDARLKLSNAGAPGGGMLAYLNVTSDAGVPVVTITAPADGSSFTQGVAINFTGTATDDPDGDLSTSLSWSSNINGPLGSGASVSTSLLSVGMHTITASATDTASQTGSASITVTVTNLAPVVTITAPADGSSFTQGVAINFTGTATDDVDGNLSASLSWSSNINGPLGSGASVSTSALSVGTHIITASATDTASQTGSASITVTINPVIANNPPVARDDIVTIFKGTASVTVNVVANDFDPDSPANNVVPSSVVITRYPRAGSLVNNFDGTVTWTSPRPSFTGRVDFQYTVKDSYSPPAESNVATVYIYVVKP